MPGSDARTVRADAFAKINLTLRVLGVRPDGFHELRTTFQSIALHDTLTCRVRPGEFRIACDDAACPVDEANLVWRAAESVWAAAGRRGAPRDAEVRLAKRIPMQAGLGGGSSDAAAAIRAFAALWAVALTAERARTIAAALGADVPFFLEGGTALGVERGDVLYPLMDGPGAWVTLVVPAFGVSTQEAFGWWDGEQRRLRPRQHASAPARSVRGVGERGWGPARKVKNVGGAVGITELLDGNDLESCVGAHHPEIVRVVKTLRRRGATCAAMSGSGSAVFGLFDRRADASAAALALAGRGRRALVTRTLNRASYARLSRPRSG
jgi:4-diphosphocytidyl-2-C-methyl-D-erythritol kinase